jgi:CRISPR-associated protein Csm5
VTLLTPLHIGSGQTLLNRFDYVIYRTRTWRLNEDRLLAAQEIDDPALAETLMTQPPGDLLDDNSYDPESDLFRYVIRGTPRSRDRGAQVIEQIKDAYDRPYLPGTSIKGAIRTALAWVAWGERHLQPELRKLNRSPRWAGQKYEREIFGRNPNEDLLRALHVSDSAPVDTEQLMLANARVFHRSGKMASPIEMEALKPDTVFELTVKIDSVLFSAWAGRRGLRGSDLLKALPAKIQQHTAQRIATEAAWFDDVPNAESILGFYRGLPQSGLPETMCLLQFGWGTGWDDKTFGSRLQEDTRFMESILASRRQGGYGLARGRREFGDAFPKSRRVLVQVRRNRSGAIIERPRSPLGWALLELSES